MKRNLLITTTLLLSLSLVACVPTSSRSNSVKTSRVTKQTANAIKAEETNEITLTDGRILLPENYRYSIFDKGDDITAYFVFNPDKSNEIADKRDGRSKGDYEKLVEGAWKKAKIEAEKKANSGFNRLLNCFKNKKEFDLTSKDVFVFDNSAYITPYNENIFLYIYEGVDRSSPQKYMDDSMIKSSFYSYIDDTIGSNIEMKNRLVDTYAMPRSSWKTINGFSERKTEIDIPEIDKWQFEESMNGKYYVITFTSYSGNHLSTTYDYFCYPHTYYGVYLVEKESFRGSLRRYYGFVFSNTSDGSYFNEKDFNYVFRQILNQFNLTQFFTLYKKDDYAYDEKNDYSKGRSFSQFKYLYSNTLKYYTMQKNKTINIDSLTDEEIEADDSITVIDFSKEIDGE